MGNDAHKSSVSSGSKSGRIPRPNSLIGAQENMRNVSFPSMRFFFFFCLACSASFYQPLLHLPSPFSLLLSFQGNQQVIRPWLSTDNNDTVIGLVEVNKAAKQIFFLGPCVCGTGGGDGADCNDGVGDTKKMEFG